MQRDTDCYGNLYSPYNVNATWTYADENIATVDFWNGTVTAVGVGDGVITADWTGTTWLANQNDDCEHNDFPVQQISDAMVSPKVRILRDNQTINGTQNVIVGQRINLSLSVDGGSPSSQTWTIPDHAVDKFEVLDSNGQPTASQTPTTGHVVSISGLSSNAINYVWTDDGSKQVQVTARINGTDYPASANFTVNKPTTTVTATGGHAAIDTSSPSKDLYLGGVTQNDVGILISRSNTTVPQGFSGSFQFVQLISGHIDATPIGGSKVTTNLVTGLDGCYPYSASSTSMDDSPFVGLVQPNATLSFAEYVGSWKVYLMFKPSSTGSSWVTLKKLTWTWDGKAILVPNSSPPQWTPSDVTAPGNPTGSDSTEFPTWTAIAPNAGGPC